MARSAFDPRVVPPPVVNLIRSIQRRTPCHLGGGAALSGAHLAHRLSNDVDLIFHDLETLREAVRELPAVEAECGAKIAVVRDAPTFVRATVELGGRSLALDLIHEAVPDVEPPDPPLEGVVVESLPELRANKLTCLLSRTEPRDLVDILFLERAGFRAEDDLPLALKKDAGIDPAVLAMLLKDFPLRPMPQMLATLTEDDLRRFRDELSERLRHFSVPE
jgi:hypothetical protein